MEKPLTKIEYIKRSKIVLTPENTSQQAREVIEAAKDNENMVLRVRNSPVFIEAAAPLTTEGIKQVCSVD